LKVICSTSIGGSSNRFKNKKKYLLVNLMY
jgi:hypothetical protein